MVENLDLIEEVEKEGDISELDNDATLKDETSDGSFGRLFTLDIRELQEGEIVKGEVVSIEGDFVTVDVGYKSEGRISTREFTGESGDIQVDVGDFIDVLVEKREDDNGIIVISKQKADKLKLWNTIEKTHAEESIIEGKIVGKVKGGLIVDIGISAFLPGSQVDIKPIRNLDKFVGETCKLKVLKYNEKRNNVVVSRRAVIEEEKAHMQKETLERLQVGEIFEGYVKNITDYGMFIDIGGVDGLLHISDMFWGKVSNPKSIYNVGDKIEVMVIGFESENMKISLSAKHLKPNPWEHIEEKFPVESKVIGKVVNVTDYGVFVELEEGVEGLLHISEMTWSKRARHPSKIVKVGDTIEVVIIDVNIPKKRISLGMKQLLPNPWDIIEAKYPIGSTITGVIRNVTDFGIFVGVDEEIDGLIHVSDISWTKKVKDPKELYKKGDNIEAVVLNVDKESERFSLGLKQLTPDPWKSIPEKYPKGSIAEGTVTSVTDFGVFLEIEEGIEGLIHVSEISADKIDSPKDFIHVGDTLKVLVVSVGTDERKIGLSLKALTEKEEKESTNNFTNDKRTDTTLGDMILRELQKKKDELEISNNLINKNNSI
ncbi:MAG: 30S ribosomal protein S1 [Thermodesulfobacteriota bacterium]|nr:30S ribosomal protein S1 [Thermodesulfobacteriota bacterium]